MSELPASVAPTDLVAVDAVRVDEHPVAVNLAGLSAGCRRTMHGALDTVEQLGLGSENATALEVPWHRLRFQHTQPVRSALAEKYAHTTANRILSTLSGELKAAWKLGLMFARVTRRRPAWRAFAARRCRLTLFSGELAGLLDTCEQEPQDIRNAATLSCSMVAVYDGPS